MEKEKKTTTIKVADLARAELKRYVANNPGLRMEDVSGAAILTYLKSKGHVFYSAKSAAALVAIVENK